MYFYAEWAALKEKGTDDTEFVVSFLSSAKESIDPLFLGDEHDLSLIFSLLESIDIEDFFEVIQEMPIEEKLTPSDVPCFSNFENGACRLNELLEFEHEGMTFLEAGFQLMNSAKPVARVKYGENHSKLAASMSLVTISSGRPAVVKNTAWGSYLTKYELKKKSNVLKKLLLRDLCIRTIVKSALNGSSTYRDAVSMLSHSTATRRRTNVKYLVDYILTGTNREDALSKIDWEL